MKGSHLFSEALKCPPYALRGQFQDTLAKLTIDACDDKAFQAKNQINTVHKVMKQNVDKVAERGDALENLEERSEYLHLNSTEFQRTATKLRRKLLWKSIKLWVVLIVMLLLVLALIGILIALGVTHKL